MHVQTADAISGVAAGAIEVRRDGQAAWQPLPTQVTATGLSAAVDDEALPKGLYFLRARAVDAAGLEASNDRALRRQPGHDQAPDPARQPRQRRPPRPTHAARGRGKRRSCRYRLATKPTVRVGRATRLYGRLTVAGKAMPGAPIEVWRQLRLDGAGWVRIGTRHDLADRPVLLPRAPRPGALDPLPLPGHADDPRPQRRRRAARAGLQHAAPEPPHA